MNETRFHIVAQASREFTALRKLALTVWQSSWLCFQNGGIAGTHQHAKITSSLLKSSYMFIYVFFFRTHTSFFF